MSYSYVMNDISYTFNCSQEVLQKIKKGSESSGLSESDFIAACIDFFFYKNIPCQNKKEVIPFN